MVRASGASRSNAGNKSRKLKCQSATGIRERPQPVNRLPALRRCYNNSDPLRHREITRRRLSCGNGRCNRLVAACFLLSLQKGRDSRSLFVVELEKERFNGNNA